MLLLNTIHALCFLPSLSFNTSYVVIKRMEKMGCVFMVAGFNTSYVVIKQYSLCEVVEVLYSFNTSYVVIKPLVNKPLFIFYYTPKPLYINTFLFFYQAILFFYIFQSNSPESILSQQFQAFQNNF